MSGTMLGACGKRLTVVLSRRSLALMLTSGVSLRQRQGHPPTHKADNQNSRTKSYSLQEHVMLRCGIGCRPMTMAVVVAVTMIMAVILTVGAAIGMIMRGMLVIVTVITL